jgi:hypothetical protein
LAVGMALTAITMVALCMCYIPALLVPLVFGFVNTLVVLHRRGPLQAFIQNFQHMKGHSASHLIMGALQMALGMLAGMLPVIGPMFALDMHVRAHRKMFGDGSEPVII